MPSDHEYEVRYVEVPDPTRPGDVVVTADFNIQPMTLPAAMRTLGWHGNIRVGGVGELLLILFSMYFRQKFAKIRDARFRVVVDRQRKGSRRWHTVHVEYFDTEQLAEARLVEILTNWAEFDFESALPIQWEDERKMRLASKRPGSKP